MLDGLFMFKQHKHVLTDRHYIIEQSLKIETEK